MSEVKKFGAMYEISQYEFEATGLTPSQLIRKHEARLIARAAEEVHLAGYRFDGWPKITMSASDYDTLRLRDRFLLRVEVNATPHVG